MYLEVYPDVIFVLNLVLDYLLLLILKKVNQRKSAAIRRLLASVVGASATVLVSIFPWMNIMLRFIIMNVITAVLMLLVAFGRMKKVDLLKQVISLYLITYLIGGLINSIYYHTNLKLYLINMGNMVIFSNLSWKFIFLMMLGTVPVVVLILWVFRWYQSSIRETYDIELFFQKNRVQTKGFLDTGNCLYDPIFKKPVIIVENSLLEKLLSKEDRNEFEILKNSMAESATSLGQLNSNMALVPYLRMIPYQSIGKPMGVMPGLVLDKLLIHRGKDVLCNEKVTAAICDNQLSTKDEYLVILHKELFKGI